MKCLKPKTVSKAPQLNATRCESSAQRIACREHHFNLINAGRPVDSRPPPPTPKEKLFGTTLFTCMTYFDFKTANFAER